MRKFTLLGTLMLVLISALSAQDLKRPKNSGLEEFDQFKNQSFDIYDASVSFLNKADGIEKFELEDIKRAEELRKDLKTLEDKAEAMKENAGKLKSIKGIKAGKNTVSAINALNKAKENFESIADKF